MIRDWGIREEGVFLVKFMGVILGRVISLFGCERWIGVGFGSGIDGCVLYWVSLWVLFGVWDFVWSCVCLWGSFC